MCLGLPDQMFASPETHLQPDIFDAVEIAARIGARLKLESELGKQRSAQFRLVGGLLGAFAPPV